MLMFPFRPALALSVEASAFQQRHFRHEFHAVPGGHNWEQWNGQLPALFESLFRQMWHRPAQPEGR
jgi:enterochelin esterase-like enzyme